MSSTIPDTRIRPLNAARIVRGRYVLYWMQASQRAEYNHALEYAIATANELRKPVVVFFGLTPSYPEGNERHYRFMLEGLAEVRSLLERRGILLVTRIVSPERGVVELARNASLVVVDRGYLGIQRRWRADASRRIACPFVQVESDVVVPVDEASNKEEYAAATIRSKIARLLPMYLVPLRRRSLLVDSLGLSFESFDIGDTDAVLTALGMKNDSFPPARFRGGRRAAAGLLGDFIERKLPRFAELRNDPSVDGLSHMSPYLHFGQISPLEIAIRVRATGDANADAYLEELIVRRELSMNFVLHNKRYDSYAGLPAWCRRTLSTHERDEREYIYSERRLEEARTHDPYWNAAQREMALTGKMHGYMRMYWGKKILEWRRRPADAFRIALRLNNRYELDGRDPNGFTGVAWCFGKHDRPWGERPIFGNVRYMNDKGLRRKFDADAYVRKIDALSHSMGESSRRNP